MFDFPMMLQLTGSLASAFGSYTNAKGEKYAYQNQSQVNANNAKISEWQAQDALQRGQVSANRARLASRQLKGKQRAALAASGVDLGTGSALNILTDTDLFGEIDAGTVTDNAQREAWALRNQALGYKSEASFLSARAGAVNPMMSGMTSLLSSAGRVAGNWYSSNSMGVTGSAGVRPPANPDARLAYIYDDPEY